MVVFFVCFVLNFFLSFRSIAIKTQCVNESTDFFLTVWGFLYRSYLLNFDERYFRDYPNAKSAKFFQWTCPPHIFGIVHYQIWGYQDKNLKLPQVIRLHRGVVGPWQRLKSLPVPAGYLELILAAFTVKKIYRKNINKKEWKQLNREVLSNA